MASVHTFTLPHYEACPVHVALFQDVTNAAFLRSQLLEANPDFDYAFLDASMILSAQHLLSATFLALHAFFTSRPKTRTPHSELVFRFSPNNNIGESYRKFGLTDSTTALIAVKLALRPDPSQDGKFVVDQGITAERVSRHLGDVVQGTSVEVGEEGRELGVGGDVEKIRKVYKLGGDGGVAQKGKRGVVVNGSEGEKRNERKEMESVILGIMALKGS